MRSGSAPRDARERCERAAASHALRSCCAPRVSSAPFAQPYSVCFDSARCVATDLESIAWTRIPGSYQLSLAQQARRERARRARRAGKLTRAPLAQSGNVAMFHGFREADVTLLKEHAGAFFPGVPVSSGEVAVSGKNWGEASVRGGQLTFAVGSKPAFHVDCADISAVSQQGKTDVLLEFAVDDTTGAMEKDSLFELSFHVPLTSAAHAPSEAAAAAEGEDAPAPALPAKVLADALLARASVGPATGEPIALFSEVAVLIPRGRFTLEMHGASMRLLGQAADFKVQYTSILRLFILPRPAAPTTLAVLALDPPIRRGATFYPHLVLQFGADEEVEMEPSVPPELADKYAGRLEARYAGAEADVFAKVLKALAGTKVTRQGSFTSPSGGAAVRCVHKADDGHLYPLEKAFFFLPKPPIFIRHDEVSEVEFERSGGGAAKTFDLKITLTSDVVYRFTNLARAEYDNLLNFLTAKKLPVASLEAPQRDMAAGLGLSDSEDDAGPLRAMGGGEDEEGSDVDEDFKAASGAESGSDSGGSGDGSGDEEEGAGGSQPARETPKKKRDKPEKKAAPKEKGDKPEKKKRAKKDPNAPKKGLSAFMFFSKARRAEVLAQNPGIAFGEVGKKLGEAWKAATAEDKAPFEAQAAEDKLRWQREEKAYKAGQSGGGGTAAAAGSDGDADMADAGGSGGDASD